MPTKKTKIRKDGSRWSVILIETNEVLAHFEYENEASRWQHEFEETTHHSLPLFKSLYGQSILGKQSTHMIIDDGVVYKTEPEPPSYHVKADAIGKPYPYFGDPTKPMDQGGIYTLGSVEPLMPFGKQGDGVQAIDMEKLQKHIAEISKMAKPSTEVRLDDFLRTVPLRDMLNAMFWQMANKAGHLGVLRPNDDQYQEICNHIFDNYIDDQKISQHAPHNRTVQETKGKDTAFATLLMKLNQYRGIRSAKMLFDDYPTSATITVMIDPSFEFDDEEHMQSWESNLTRLFKDHKPAKLDKLEIMFTRTEVL